MTNNTNNNAIDVMKFICAILVVIIHAPPLLSYNESANFILVDIIARIAVPFFFVCAGYFFFQKINLENGKIKNNSSLKTFKTYTFHLIKIYGFWTIFYLLWWIPLWYIKGNLTFANLKGYMLSIFISGSFYHLWYIVALLYGLLFAFFLLKYINVKIVILTAIIFYFIGTIQYSYGWVFSGNFFYELFDRTYSILGSLSVGVFRTFPYLIMGLVFSKFQIKLKGFSSVILSLVGLICLGFEVGLLQAAGNSSRFSNVIFTGIAIFFIFNTVSKIKLGYRKIYPQLRKISSIIYFVHPMFINVSGLILSQYLNTNHSMLLFITVICYTLLFSFGMVRLSQVKNFNHLKSVY